ncbi:hypothetical protein HMPREF3213_00578 [Heyndrickxia coagulans]|uniref:Uncharacterized protein n=1 Tax=Heyndrickxia coagulans TaxID=1398 RepID=A0A133L0D8_HEYCO|nr:hypothetical protein HMPREF3213_00578 [Heyndrickxia coagulans]
MNAHTQLQLFLDFDVCFKVEPGDEVHAGQVIVIILEEKEAEVPVQ